MTKFKPLPPQEELRRLFDYDPETGELTWKARTSNRIRVGDRAGRIGEDHYRRVGIHSIVYLESRIIWCWMTGDDPSNQCVDHKNLLRYDNRWKNLRLASFQENNRNRRSKCYFFDNRGKAKPWFVQLTIDRKAHHFGSYKTEAEAQAAADAKRQELYGDFA